jgi:hypothetical protein
MFVISQLVHHQVMKVLLFVLVPSIPIKDVKQCIFDIFFHIVSAFLNGGAQGPQFDLSNFLLFSFLNDEESTNY